MSACLTTPPLPRRFPARLSARLGIPSAALLPILLAGCTSDSPSAPEKPASALYECRGVPGYSHIDWDRLKEDLKAHPLECQAQGADTSFAVVLPAATEPPQKVQVAVRNVIMDADCRYLAQYEDTASVITGVMNPIVLWNGRLSDGSRAGTGEYYVNTEIRWPDGRKDTTYQKIGFIQSSCGG